MLHGYVCHTSKSKIFFKLKFSLPVFFLLMELIVKAAIYGCFTWSKRIRLHPEWWLLFTLAFIWPSFCNSRCYCQYCHFCIHKSVRTCWYCQPLLNWKELKIAVVFYLVCRGVHCYWDDVMIPEKKNSAILTFYSKWWTYYKFERLSLKPKRSLFRWPYDLGNILKYLVNREPCVGPVSYYQISPIQYFCNFVGFCPIFSGF